MSARRNRATSRKTHSTTRAFQDGTVSPAERHPPLLRFALALGLIGITAGIYAPAYNYSFVDWDDPSIVADNPYIADGLTWSAVRWASTATYYGDWRPVTWLSHLLDVQLFGVTPGAHHLTSVLLHALSAALVFGLFAAVTGAMWRSLCVAALFAVHPLHVESTAWIAARRDVLSTVFWMLALWAYAAYVRSGNRSRYVLVVFLFAMGLMTKPMLVTLPATLLLLDFWPLNRIRLDQPSSWIVALREKAALFVLSAAVTVITMLGRGGEGRPSVTGALPLGFRLTNAVESYAAYVADTVWPSGLTIFYPYPDVFSPIEVTISAISLGAVTWLAWRNRQTQPYLLFGWLFFLITVLPASGVIQIGDESRADRYMYVPAIGLFVMGVWGLADFSPPALRRVALPPFATVAIVVYSLTARAQLQHWRDREALWSHALAVTENNVRAHNNLGNALQENGRVGEALQHYRKALRIQPAFAEAHANLGNALAAQGKPEEAVTHYTEALRLRPSFANAHNSLGSALDDLGRLDEAISHLHEALRLDPNLAAAHNNLAAVLVKQHKLEDATRQLEAAIRARPTNPDYRMNYAAVLKEEGRVEDAIAALEALLRIAPDHRLARQLLASLQPR